LLLRIWAVLLCFGGTFLQASKKVELISDFDISEAFYSKALQSQGLDWDVTRVSIKKYNKAK
jgi:hypothetical protein